MKRIGLYGGSFNPCHVGHQATILYALAVAQLDELIVAPVYHHPYGKQLVDFNERLVMCQMLLEPFDQDNLTVSAIERENWESGGKGLTVNAVKYLLNLRYLLDGERPHIVLIMGSDLREDIKKWEGIEELTELCTAGWASFFFVDRVDGISSTAVREAIRQGKLVDRWLPKSIHDYVFKKGFYL